MKKSLSVWLEDSNAYALYNIISTNPEHFVLATNPEEAEIILFTNDEPSYIRRCSLFKQWPQKCVVISECDVPSYFLPSCYASNRRTLLSIRRSQTIPFLLSQRDNPNQFIKDIKYNNSRRYLYSFKGGSTSWVRKVMFKKAVQYDDVHIESTNQYHHWNYEDSYADKKKVDQKSYADLLEQSSFFLCPRGAGSSSIRIFEVMQAGRVPVIISDDWVPVYGIPWNEFAIFVPEKKITSVDSIIRSQKDVATEYGLKARKVWDMYCRPGNDSFVLAQAIQNIQANRNEKKEQLLRSLFPLLELIHSVRNKILYLIKIMILKFFQITGMKFPYSLNRSVNEQLYK